MSGANVSPNRSVNRKLRLAFFSPFSPQRTGITDYSEDLLPYLAEIADVTLVAGPYRPSGPVVQNFRVIQSHEFLSASSEFDIPIYQIGNTVEHHGYMLDCLEREPGIVVLHDYCLNYLILNTTLLAGDVKALQIALDPVYGDRKNSLARRLLLGVQDPFALCFAGKIVSDSRAVIVHSQYVKELLQRDFSDKRVQVIPMGVPLELPRATRTELKTKYGFRQDDFVVASINSPAYNKRLSLVLEAIRSIRDRCNKLRLVILSGKHFDDQTSKLLGDPALRDIVTVPGWLAADSYAEFIHLSDVVVDMRYPSGAETSASLSRGLAFGKPAIVSAQGTFLELPDSLCIKVSVGEGEVNRLAAALMELSSNAERRNAMANAAREYAFANLRLDQAARQYVNLAKEVIDGNLSAAKSDAVQKPKALERIAVSTIYKASRTVGFLRTYGFSETLERIRTEFAQRRQSRLNPDA